MTYYDHGTALAFKLDRWSDARILRNHELEAAYCARRALSNSDKRESIVTRLLKKMGSASSNT